MNRLNSPLEKDRYLTSDVGVDVIIPMKGQPPLEFHNNLKFHYAEIPIRRLLIGNCEINDSYWLLSRPYPRMTVLDQRCYRSLGYCIAELIECVSSEWFVYLHADVRVVGGWYDVMWAHSSLAEFMECGRVWHDLRTGAKTVAAAQNAAARPYSGSQLARRSAFAPFLHKIEDDGYLYRNEDLVFRALVENHGGRYARVLKTHHEHQVFPSSARDADWYRKMYTGQIKGIVKYCPPKQDWLISAAAAAFRSLEGLDAEACQKLLNWISRTSPAWRDILGSKPN